MMNRIFTIIALLATAFAHCAESPLKTADDYLFLRPVITNNIKGVVMGETGDYGTMRSEDFAFLGEAFTERVALKNGCDRDSVLSYATNMPPGYPTNTLNGSSVHKFDTLNFDLDGVFDKIDALVGGSYLNPTNEFSTSARLVTNDVTVLTRRIVPYVIDESFQEYHTPKIFSITNILSQEIESGSDTITSVLRFSSNTVNIVSATKTMSIADYCMKDYVYPFALDDVYVPERKTAVWFRRSDLTNIYQYAKLLTRTCPTECTVSISNKYITSSKTTFYGGEDDQPPEEEVSTNSYASVDFFVTSSDLYTDQEFKSQFRNAEDQIETMTRHEKQGIKIFAVYTPSDAKILFDTGISSNMTAYYNGNIVKDMHVFALADVSSSCDSMINFTTPPNSSITNTYYKYTNWTGRVMLPIGERISGFENKNGRIYAAVDMTAASLKEMAKKACSVAGITYRDKEYYPPFELTETPGKGWTSDFEDGIGEGCYGDTKQSSWYLNVGFSFLVSFEFNFRTKLEGWD